MARQEVPVGTIRVVNGTRVDHTRRVQFEAEELAVRTKHLDSDRTHGVTETLYYTADERMLVHVADWSERPENALIYCLVEVTREDLRAGARFGELGQAAWAWLRG